AFLLHLQFAYDGHSRLAKFAPRLRDDLARHSVFLLRSFDDAPPKASYAFVRPAPRVNSHREVLPLSTIDIGTGGLTYDGREAARRTPARPTSAATMSARRTPAASHA